LEDAINQRDTPRQDSDIIQDMTLQQAGSVEARGEGITQPGGEGASAVWTRGNNTEQLTQAESGSRRSTSQHALPVAVTQPGGEGAPAIWTRGNNTKQLIKI
jgi:hypothetical protein